MSYFYNHDMTWKQNIHKCCSTSPLDGWLPLGKSLQRVFDLREEIYAYFDEVNFSENCKFVDDI